MTPERQNAKLRLRIKELEEERDALQARIDEALDNLQYADHDDFCPDECGPCYVYGILRGFADE